MTNAQKLSVTAELRDGLERLLESATQQARINIMVKDEKTAEINKKQIAEFEGKLAALDVIEKEIKAEIEKELKA